jgi:7-cyano-7-deazaguanine synthase
LIFYADFHAGIIAKIGKIRTVKHKDRERMPKKAVCIISGGMDSALSAAIAKAEGYEVIGVHFNYGQRTEKRELLCFRKLTEELGAVREYEIDLDFFGQIGASALTDRSIAVPTAGIEEGVPVTYVPFRNGIFLSIAAAIAEKHQAEALYIGVVEEDSSGYPDCRESYIRAMEKAIDLGTREETKLKIKMPLVALKKSQIVQKALKLSVPLEHTWSCYQSEEEACGVCDSCRLRLKGFRGAGVKDPILYRSL